MTNEREIDILDLLAEMLKHWKGAIVCLLIGVLAFGAYDYMKSKPAAPVEEIVDEVETEDEVIENAEEDLIGRMTFAEKKAVDIALEYEALYTEAKANGDVDNVITLNKVIIDSVKTFTNVQLKYFVINSNSDMWGDELALLIDDTAESETVADSHNSVLASFHHNKKKMIVCGVVLFILYLAFFGAKYVLDGHIKATDDLSKLANIPELGKIYTVKAPKFFIDKGIFNMKYHGQKVMTEDASVELIAAKISAKAKANDVSAITFIGCSLDKKADAYCKKLSESLKNTYQIDSNIINDVIYNKAAIEAMQGTNNLIIVETAGITSYADFGKEIEFIKQLDINTLGGIVIA